MNASAESGVRHRLWPLLFLILTVGLVSWPVARGRLPGDLGDARFNHAVLEFSFQWLQGNEPALFSPKHQFYPHPNTLAYSDSLLSAAPPYWLLRAALPPAQAFGAWSAVWVALNFAAMYLLARAVGLSPLAASAGALLFAGGLPRMAQLNHIQLFTHAYFPLAMWGCVRCWQSFQRGDRGAMLRFFAIAVASAALQLMSSFYLGWFMVFGAVVAVVALVVGLQLRRALADQHHQQLDGVFQLAPRLVAQLKERISRRDALFMGTWATGWVVVLGLFFLPYVRAQAEVGPRDISEAFKMMPRLTSWFSPPAGHRWYGEVFPSQLELPHEHHLFVGWVALAALALGLLARVQSRWWKVSAIFVTVLVALSTHYGGGSPWQWVFAWFPGGQAIRAVSRIIFLILPFAAVCVGFLIDATRSKLGPAAAVIVALMLVGEHGLANVEPMYDYTMRQHDERVEVLKAHVSPECGAFWVAAPDGVTTPLDAVWVSLTRNIPTFNGYSGNSPPHWGETVGPIWEQRQDVLQQRVQQWLAFHGDRTAPVCIIR